MRTPADWMFNRLFTHLLDWVGWVLVLAVGGGVIVGSVSLRGDDQDPADPVAVAAGPIRIDVQRYSARFAIASKHALREHRDFLADYSTFCAIWNEISPDQPMMLKVISRASSDSASKLLPAFDRPAEVIDARNFPEVRALLREIETLILEGDGSGRGRLARSGFEAEPAVLEPGQ